MTEDRNAAIPIADGIIVALVAHMRAGGGLDEFFADHADVDRGAILRALDSNAAPDLGEIAKLYADRIRYEDEILNDRTNIVLVVNGLAAVAVSMQGSPRAIIAGVALLINMLWIPSAAVHGRYQQALKARLFELRVPADWALWRRTVAEPSKGSGATSLVSKGLPWLLTASWAIGLILALRS